MKIRRVRGKETPTLKSMIRISDNMRMGLPIKGDLGKNTVYFTIFGRSARL